MQDKPGDGPVVGDAENPDRSSGGLVARLISLFQPRRDSCPPEMLTAGRDLSAPVRRQTRRMMGRLVNFSRLRVDDVLVPRAEIMAVEAASAVHGLMEIFARAQHSRLPVFRETLDDILGMVHIKDLFRLLQENMRPLPPGEATGGDAAGDLVLPAAVLERTVESSGLLRPVLFAPPSMPAADLLLKMQSTHLHMAVVVDEYGGTEGIVTIEDLVEQIVGEIADEHDEEEDLVVPADDGYIVSARAPLEDVENLLGVDLLPREQDEDVDTVGGFIFTMLGRVPVRGEVVRHDAGYEFEILDADPRRIRRLRIRRAAAGGDTPRAAAE